MDMNVLFLVLSAADCANLMDHFKPGQLWYMAVPILAPGSLTSWLVGVGSED